MALKSKLDLVMWTKNGSATLAPVLKRITEVVPADIVNKKLIVDDRSTDNTCEIAESCGWRVVPNDGNGISEGANTALRHVETTRFASFEQDLLLSRDWWGKIPPHFLDPKVAIASGIRFDFYPVAVRIIQEYTAQRYKTQEKPGGFFPYVKTLDNTLYRTEAIRKIGGFPNLAISVGIDHVLSQKLYQSGLRWKTDYDVRSIHLRQGLKEELAHNYWYGTHADQLEWALFHKNVKAFSLILRALLSPIRGLEIAFRKNAAEALYIYPLMRLHFLRGVVDSRRGVA